MARGVPAPFGVERQGEGDEEIAKLHGGRGQVQAEPLGLRALAPRRWCSRTAAAAGPEGWRTVRRSASARRHRRRRTRSHRGSADPPVRPGQQRAGGWPHGWALAGTGRRRGPATEPSRSRGSRRAIQDTGSRHPWRQPRPGWPGSAKPLVRGVVPGRGAAVETAGVGDGQALLVEAHGRLHRAAAVAGVEVDALPADRAAGVGGVPVAVVDACRRPSACRPSRG